MEPEVLMATAVRLAAGLEAFAALAAYARIESESLDADPEMCARLRDVACELLGDADLPPGPVAAQVVGMVRSFLRQAVDLVDDPGRAGGWEHLDPALLQGIGRLSGAVVAAIAAAAASLDGLGARFASPDARFLDVGTGTGWIAIAVAHAFPAVQVVGIDVFDAPLALARTNVESEGLGARIELRVADIATMDDVDAFDAMWLPLPFLPHAVVPAALAVARRALRPGGWVLPGLFAGPDEPLAQRLVDLRTVRGGGYPWPAEELIEQIATAGFTDVSEIPRTWPAPVRLFAGRAPSP